MNQRYSPNWLSTLSMIWQIITDFLKLLSDFEIYINALLSLFLTAYHYSLGGGFFPAKDTKAGATEGCQTWMSLTLSVTECMSSLYVVSLKPEAIKIIKLCVFLIVIFLLGLLHLYFNQVLWHEKTVCPVYLPLFHSQYASHGHLLEEWF